MARRAQSKIRRVRFAFDFEIVERTLELSFRRKNSREGLQRAKVRVLELKFRLHGRHSRFVRAPGPKLARAVDFSMGRGIREQRMKRRGLIEPEIVQIQMMNKKQVRRLAWVFRQRLQERIVGKYFLDDDGIFFR